MRLWPVALLLLSGCAIFDGPVPLHQERKIHVVLVDDLPGGIGGRANWFSDTCTVWLRRSTYPRCLQHEIRHCFEGPFHGNNASSEDCFN